MAGASSTAARGSARRSSTRVKPETIAGVYAQWCAKAMGLLEAAWERAHWKVQGAAVAALLIVALWVASKPATLVVVLLALLVVGLIVWNEHHKRDLATRGGARRSGFRGRLYPHRLWCRAILLPLVLGLVALLGVMPRRLETWPLSVTAVVLAVLLVWRELPEGDDEGDEWYAHDNLVDDVFHPSVLGPWREDSLPRLRFLGPPRTDEFGTAVMLALPGISWEALAAKHANLAARLGVSRRLLVVSHGGRDDEGRPYGENVVRVWVGTPRKAVTNPSPIATASRTNWRQPVRIGVDMRGRVVRFLTVDVHSVLVAKTRAGKTWLARIVVGHALLDPSVDLYVLNGKDKRDDWRPMAPACIRYVGVDDEDSLAQAFDVLDDLHALCKARKDAAASDLTPVVVLLEEWYSIRSLARDIGAKASKGDDEFPATRDTTLQALDSAAARLGSVASGYGVHIIGLAQRGTADYVAMGLKANMSQRLVGMVGDTREVQWTIGTVPGELPAVAGEFLAQMDEDQPTLMQGDAMDDEAWASLCRRAIALRRAEGRLPEQRTCANTEALAADTTPEHVVETPAVTLEGQVRDLLAEHGHLSSTDLLGLLPEAVAPRTRELLGRRLGEMDGVEQGYVGSKRGWRLTGGAPAVAGSASAAEPADRQRTAPDPRVNPQSRGNAAALEVQP